MTVPYQRDVCQYCQKPIRPDAGFIVCMACSARHHIRCWEKGEGCATPDCGSNTGSEMHFEEGDRVLPASEGPSRHFPLPVELSPSALGRYLLIPALMIVSFALGTVFGSTVLARQKARSNPEPEGRPNFSISRSRSLPADSTDGEEAETGASGSAAGVSATATTQPPAALPGGAASAALSPQTAETVIAKRAQETITALKNRDMDALAALVHPDKGVRFSPSASVNVQSDQLIMAQRLKSAIADKNKYPWGKLAGREETISLSFEDYLGQFVYDRDFANARQITYNKQADRGGAPDNSLQVYPGSIIVEYYSPGLDPRQNGNDWESLRLVFQQKDQADWYLVGVIHDQGA